MNLFTVLHIFLHFTDWVAFTIVPKKGKKGGPEWGPEGGPKVGPKGGPDGVQKGFQ